MKYATTVRQRFDFTCGGASLATLLTYYLGRPTTEVEILDILRSRYPGQAWPALQEKGFSFDDLIWAAGKLGFQAQAVSISSKELAKIDGPVIVHLKKGEYQHFTVLRRRMEDRVYLSDPLFGATSYLVEEFDREFTGAALAVWKDAGSVGRSSPLTRLGPMLPPNLVVNVQNPPLTVGRPF